ncbi:proton channel OtopLc isoform X2 [Bemisia tabaci]|uniref:proton channel OtopLc isoform X2 n=1 Tax=Bemisia tabaci TaxID=7038 RepID=UPI003B27D172
MDDSSPDLSLKLRRGSSDSRDSFYMDFAQGIDSDIEEVAAGTSGMGQESVDTDASTPTAATVKNENDGEIATIDFDADAPCWSSREPMLLPSPASPSAVIVSPETLSHHSSPTRQLSQTLRTVMSSLPDHPVTISLSKEALATTLSALYGKLVVVMGIAFPMSEVISTYIPSSFYESFYLYLYFGSMAFLFYMYAMLCQKDPRTKKIAAKKKVIKEDGSSSGSSENESASGQETGTNYMSDLEMSIGTDNHTTERHVSPKAPFQHYGSFYLRMGAVAFGIGSMIYSGLEFGQYFELERNTKCHNVLLALTPATRMAFTFIQMYFIFLNDEQQMRVTRHRTLARFGLMHMIGTNLSIWLNVLIQETKHEILTFYNPENNTIDFNPSHRIGHINAIRGFSTTIAPVTTQIGQGFHHRATRGLKGPHHIYECRRTDIIGSLVQNASPFLFPCTIEYSLICAAILYVMWKNISRVRTNPQGTTEQVDKIAPLHYKRSPHHYSVDCAQAHKGLFVGILFLVFTIISLILFFVLVSRPELVNFAVMEVNICEVSLYGTTTLATLIGMIQVRQLKFDGSRNLELDNILLVGAQIGIFLYSTFTIIGGHFTLEKNTVLVLITASASLLQTVCQTMFILDASRRSCITPEQIRKKPGREIVTFLLVTNLAMWAINTLEKSRADSHPIQLHFYGLWAWTIITHVSMPLAIFYRFHSTVCLCEIWKRAYKMKPTYM